MNCNFCGAVITSDMEKCPFCGADNPEYLEKQAVINELELKLDEQKEATRKSFSTLWKDQLCDYCLRGSVVMLAVMWLAVFAAAFIGEGIFSFGLKAEKIEQMTRYYEEECYDELYAYMSDEELFSSENYYKFGQAALMWADMNNFRITIYGYIEQKKNGRIEDEVSASSVLYRAAGVLCRQWQTYEELDSENEELWEDYRNEIKLIFTTYLNFTDEEFEDCFKKDEASYNYDYEEILRERNEGFR